MTLRPTSLAALGCLTLAIQLVFTAEPGWGANATDESRAISAQVATLIKASKLDEAEVLARKGLALCGDVGPVEVFCTSQFNDSLGDIAFGRKEYEQSISFYQH